MVVTALNIGTMFAVPAPKIPAGDNNPPGLFGFNSYADAIPAISNVDSTLIVINTFVLFS